MKNIAIIDDDRDIVDLAAFYIEKEGFIVRKYYSGDTFLNALNTYRFDCIVLDIMLPRIDGISILKFLKANERTRNIPVLLLTAKGSEGEIIQGMESGADDYITKPFSPKVLAAKVKAFTRERDVKAVIEKGNIKIDFEKYEVSCSGKNVKLTITEFKLLRALLESPEKVFGRDELLEIGWGDITSPLDRAVDVHIRHIREKLGECEKHIKTVRGVGYKFSEELD